MSLFLNHLCVLCRLVKSASSEVAEVEKGDEFEYKDPVDGSVAKHQGVRFLFKDGSRLVRKNRNSSGVRYWVRAVCCGGGGGGRILELGCIFDMSCCLHNDPCFLTGNCSKSAHHFLYLV